MRLTKTNLKKPTRSWKIWGLCLALCLLLSCATLVVLAATGGGSGCDSCNSGIYDNGICDTCGAYEPAVLSDGTYEIYNAGQLYWFANKINSVTNGKTAFNARLMNHIILNPGTFDESGNYTPAHGESVRAWTPISGYKGTFDGGIYDGTGAWIGNYSISGLYYNSSSENYVGMFTALREGAIVKNLTIASGYVCGKEYVGALAGRAWGVSGDVTVTNDYNYATVVGSTCVGGVVGHVESQSGTAIVSRCYNAGKVTGNYCGGVVGYLQASYVKDNASSVQVTDCYNTAALTGSWSGGVIGNARVTDSSLNSVIIKNCYNMGTLTNSDEYTGSVVGYANSLQSKTGKMEIKNCYYLEGTYDVGMNAVTGVTGETIVKTADEFKSGIVAWLLNEKRSEGTASEPLVWFQTCGEGSPAFSGKTVYGGYISCDGDMSCSNSKTTVRDTPHLYINGICTATEGETHYEVPEGQGKSSDPYLIDNAGKLYWFSNLVASGKTSVYAKLTNDIVINAGTFDENGNYTPGEGEAEGALPRVWTPINYSDLGFSGSFDGGIYDDDGQLIGRHTISGVYVNDSTAEYVGLFGFAKWGTVKNLVLDNSYVCGKQYVGGLVGYARSVTVQNVTVKNSYVIGTKDVGGVIGLAEGRYSSDQLVTEDLCNVDTTVKGGTNVGGVVGQIKTTTNNSSYTSGLTVRLKNSSNTGAVSGTGDNVGGVVGYVFAIYKDTEVYIIDCSNSGTVTGDGSAVGGVIGYANVASNATLVIRRDSNTGTVNSRDARAGGVVGCIVNDNADNISAEMKNCTNSGAVTSVNGCAGGVVGYTEGPIYVNCVSNSGTVTYTGTGVDQGAGGLIGYIRVTNDNSLGIVVSSYNVGTVSGENVGGIANTASAFYGNLTFRNCYSVGTLTGTQAGGILYLIKGTGVGVYACYYMTGTASQGVYSGKAEATAMTAEQFRSGEVTYLLNGSKSSAAEGGSLIWYQTCGEGLPSFQGKTVYLHFGQSVCSADYIFSNEETVTFAGEHHYDNGFCACGDYEAATWNSEGGYYEIANGGQFYWFADKVRSGETGICAKLMADIFVNPGTFDENGNYTAAGKETLRTWTPIGTSDAPFIGTFDGNGFTISGLYFKDDDMDNVGLFGYVGEGGTVKNVTVKNSYFNGGNNVGGVAGTNAGSVTGCINEAITYGVTCVGGVIGNDLAASSDNVHSGLITGSDQLTGGFTGASVSLGTDLSITYTAKFYNVSGEITPYAVFTKNGETFTVYGVALSDGTYKFTFEHIAPQTMGDNIKAELYVGEQLMSVKLTYSVKENLLNLAAKNADNSELLTLIYNTLNYGAAAQKYVGYKTDDLVNAGYENKAVSFANTDGADQYRLTTANGAAHFAYATVEFDNVNRIVVVISGNAQVKIDGNYVTVTDGICKTAGISVTDFDKVFNFDLYENGICTQRLWYSVNAYAARVSTDLNNALFNYGMAAKAYAASRAD